LGGGAEFRLVTVVDILQLLASTYLLILAVGIKGRMFFSEKLDIIDQM
jgi:hypothetical protein